jgi:hypothetical protein
LTTVVIHSLDPQIAAEMKGQAPDLNTVIWTEAVRRDHAGIVLRAAQGEETIATATTGN